MSRLLQIGGKIKINTDIMIEEFEELYQIQMERADKLDPSTGYVQLKLNAAYWHLHASVGYRKKRILKKYCI